MKETQDNKLSILKDEDELLEHAAEIDLLVVASPTIYTRPLSSNGALMSSPS